MSVPDTSEQDPEVLRKELIEAFESCVAYVRARMLSRLEKAQLTSGDVADLRLFIDVFRDPEMIMDSRRQN